jgi:hypothetical protein
MTIAPTPTSGCSGYSRCMVLAFYGNFNSRHLDFSSRSLREGDAPRLGRYFAITNRRATLGWDGRGARPHTGCSHTSDFGSVVK